MGLVDLDPIERMKRNNLFPHMAVQNMFSDGGGCQSTLHRPLGVNQYELSVVLHVFWSEAQSQINYFAIEMGLKYIIV